jgi:4-amino-4-deoxy-L-arabinose transferase-like glycosyltransferase
MGRTGGAGTISWSLVFLILAGLALRVVRLNFQPLWWDEGYSVWFATHPLGQMAALTAQDIHPPLYYALLHGWTWLTNTGPVALRLFSVATGVLAIPAIYVAGRRTLGQRAAMFAALLWAFNPLAIYYSQEVRMYGLVALLSAAIVANAWPILANPTTEVVTTNGGGTSTRGSEQRLKLSLRPRVRDLVPYVALASAALYTQYYAVFLPVGLTLYACWTWRRQPVALVRWLAAQAVVALLCLPWVLYATPRLIPYISQKVVADADRPLAFAPYLARHLSAYLAGHLEGFLAPYGLVALVLLAPVLAGLVLSLWAWRSPAGKDRHGQIAAQSHPDGAASGSARAPMLMLATLLLTAILLGYAISTRYPFFPDRGERLLLLALPPFILLVAASLDGLWGRSRLAALATVGLAGTIAVASLWGFYTVPRYAEDDYRPLLARIVEQGRPEDTIFAVYPWQVGYWRSYGDPNGPAAVLTAEPAWGPAVAEALDAALGRGHVWFPEHLALGAILETRVENYLTQRSRSFLNQWYGPGTRLSAWARDPDGQAAQQPVALTSGPVSFALPALGEQGLVLAEAFGRPEPVPAVNAVMPLTLRWRAASPPPALAASVRLVDDLGQIWAQHDYEPVGGPAPADGPASGAWQAEDKLGLLVPAGTPPGRYHVAVSVRAKGDDRDLEAADAKGQRRAGAAPLFDVEVAPTDRVLGPERLPINRRQTANLDDGLRFLGSSTGNGPWVPGATRQINLFWQALATPSADYTAFVQLLGPSGQPVAAWEAPPGAAYETSRWTPGSLLRTQANLRPPADLPDGRYRLIAGLYRRSNGQRLRISSGGTDHLDLGTVTMTGRAHNVSAPAPSHPATARFGSLAQLVGYDLNAPATPRPGDRLPLTLHWQAASTGERPYTVFVHLVNPESTQLVGAGDGEPGMAHFPTTGWVPGEYLADEHFLAIDSATPPGTYRIAIGLYDPTTGQRLLLPDGADQFLLETPITVR